MDAIALPPVIDTPAATPLRRTLLDAIAAGRPLRIDAGQVERIGQAGLQVLAAAQATAAARGIDFGILRSSPAFDEMTTLAALPFLPAA